ncbi:hypothetical protein BST81_20180 [Leptolyngbya sp. 'hensonii']|uniref:hypothetical protein n=1 Tax=Leptolyngbya sp. 'hensonii' TaxID=1922337 RepID=UPI00094FF1CB|nr:hypothetical protein [Leptolyngbya sp. 'hensonii']OLP16521.1 hypothetical protein BST81_20180 [Leptolyngbya sp. 'hensonii']
MEFAECSISTSGSTAICYPTLLRDMLAALRQIFAGPMEPEFWKNPWPGKFFNQFVLQCETNTDSKDKIASSGLTAGIT